MAEIETRSRVRFDGFEIDRRAREIYHRGQRVPLQQKPMQVLLSLLERAGGVVTRDELRSALWADDVFVDHVSGLNTAVRKLRDALGDDAERPRFIETVPRVGYRFIGDVVEAAPEPSRGRRRALGLVVAVAVAGAAWFVATALRTPSPSAVPVQSEARALYLEALYHKSKHEPDSLARAIAALERVVALEPTHAPSWALMGECLAMRQMSPVAGPPDIDAARRAVARALTLEPELPEALRVQGMLALFFDWELDRARALLERASALRPLSAENQLALATLLSVTGRHDEAIARVRRAVDLDPESLVVRSDAGYFLLRANRPREAVDECRRALALEPDFVPARSCLAEAFARLGDVDAQRAELRSLMLGRGADALELAALDRAADPRRAHASWELARLVDGEATYPILRASYHAVLGDSDAAIGWLQRAYEDRRPLLIFAATNPSLASLARDRRFVELLDRLGLESPAPEQRAGALESLGPLPGAARDFVR